MPRIIFRKRYAVVRLVVTQCSIHFVVEITAVNKFERQCPCPVVVVWVRHTTFSILLRDEPSEGFEWEFPELRDVFTMVVRKHVLKELSHILYFAFWFISIEHQ